MSSRLVFLKTVLWAAVGVLAAITVVRFVHGLGAVTNLSDAAPWGLWVAFDVMAGVALAAGGFVLAATVYVFGLEKYRRFVRPAILTAWLGYMAVAVGLIYDLGLPWHILHPAIYPQHHSVLFEVAMCVMLYLTVLTLEFAPVILEHPLFQHPLFGRVLGVLKKVTIPLVITGIVLSTLHQSSLGSLFLITPYRLHPLWYSPIIYVHFFISAIGLGLMMVMLESLLAGFFLRHKIPTRLLSGLGLAGAGVLGLYATIRIADLAVRGVLGMIFDGSWQSTLLLVELGISAILPASLLLSKRVRSSVAGLAVSSGLAVSGMILYRLNVCVIAFQRPEGAHYFPSWMEVAVSLGIVAGATLIFLFFVERMKVYDHEDTEDSAGKRSYDPSSLQTLMPGRLSAPRRYSGVAVGAAAFTILFLPVGGVEPVATPVSPPRSADGELVDRSEGRGRLVTLAAANNGTVHELDRTPVLKIDGNRHGPVVLFDHEGHAEREGGDESCSTCHHLDMPLDRNTSCHECHRDMYEVTPLFDHESHVRELNGSAGCIECHTSYEGPKSYETATPCSDCHEVTLAASPIIETPQPRWADAASYLDAMHNLCTDCHETRLAESPAQYSEDLAECAYCHDADWAPRLREMAPSRNLRGTLMGARRD